MPRRSLRTTSPSTSPPSTASTTPSTSAPTTTSPPNSSTTPPPADPTTFHDHLPLPQCLIFDLDYTLWPFWVDTHPSPPFKALPPTHPRHGLAAKDRRGSEFGFYDQVPDVLRACRQAVEGRGIKVAVASRTHTPEEALQLLDLLQVPEQREGKEVRTPARECFHNIQAYPGSKMTHIQRISKKLDIPFEEMVFFDDESRNRDVERELGVPFVLVRDGVDLGVVDEGVRLWRKRRGLGEKKGEGKAEKRVVELVGGHAEL